MTDRSTRSFPIIPVIAGVVGVALIALVVLTFDQGGSVEFGEPEIAGAALVPLPEGAGDPALGVTAPEVTGTDFDENPVEISHASGKSKVVLFLAHWCSHCQREVPIVQEWLDTTPLPEGVEFISVATSISNTRENYPPSAWLDREGWTQPVIVDAAGGSIASAYGLTAFPYWVFLDDDGNVMARVTGGIATSDLDVAVATLQAQVDG